MSDIEARLAALSPERRRALERLLAAQGETYNVFPLSSQQRRLWFQHQLAPASPYYNVPLAVRLVGALAPALLEQALRLLVERHEALRTAFHALGGEPVQRVLAPALDWQALEARGDTLDERRAWSRAALEREVRQPFDLELGRPLRARLLRVDAREHVLVLTLHHIVCDGWSLGVLLRETLRAYAAAAAGRAPELPALRLQYADYAAWQAQREREGAYAGALAYWRRALDGAPEALDLPCDHARPERPTWGGAQVPLELPAALVDGLRKLAAGEQATLFMALMAALQALLARWSGCDDVCVGTPAAQRPRTELEGVVGLFANTLVVRTDVSGRPPARALVGRARDACLSAFAHQEVPLEQVVDALGVERRPERHPLFQVVMALQSAPLDVPAPPGLEVQVEPLDTGTVQFDLVLNLQPAGGGLAGGLAYSTDLFDERRAVRFAAHYRRLLQGFCERPDDDVTALPLDDEDPQRWGAWGRAAAAELPGCREIVLLDRQGRVQVPGVPGEVHDVVGEAPADGDGRDLRPDPARPGVWLRRAGWRAEWSDDGRLLPPRPPDTRAEQARQIERLALQAPGVSDAHALWLERDQRWCLVLVSADPTAADGLSAEWRVAAGNGALTQVVPALPREADGSVDAAAARALAGDAAAAQRLESAVCALPGVTAAVVVRRADPPATRELDFASLLPGVAWPAGAEGVHGI